MTGNVIVVGAGHAGESAAALLRQHGHEGSIVVIGAEPRSPYQRPPLSKAWLKGSIDADALAIRPEPFYQEQRIHLRLDTTVVSVDRHAKKVRLQSGEVLRYDSLVLATGAAARKLAVPGAQLGAIFELRTAKDAQALKKVLGPGKRLAIIGGGYVGLEVASSAITLGTDVVVLEREARCLARVACSALSDFFEAFHRRRGVRFEFGVDVERLTGDGDVSGVVVQDGRVLPCDAVLIGIGAVPNIELARQAGLACSLGGVDVDADARTSDPFIYAIGDVACRLNPMTGRRLRLESVPNAMEQANQAAAHICGRESPKPEVPWFWSEQYDDLKLQIAGMAADADSTVIRGDVQAARFALFHLRGNVLVAVEAINAPQEFMMGKRWIAAAQPLDVDRLTDVSIPLKSVVSTQPV